MGDVEPVSADARDAEAGGECAVCVCVHIRPLVRPELLEGCQECLSVTHGQPQARSRTRAQICASAGARLLSARACRSVLGSTRSRSTMCMAATAARARSCCTKSASSRSWRACSQASTPPAWRTARRAGALVQRARSAHRLSACRGGAPSVPLPPRQCLQGDLGFSERLASLVRLAQSGARLSPARHAEQCQPRRRARGRRTRWAAPSRRTAGRAA